MYFHLFFAREIIPNDLSSLESNENFDMDDSFHLEVLQVRVPPSASRQPCAKARRQSLAENHSNKRYIVTIRNNNRVCAGRTLAVGIVYQEIKANPDNVELQLDYEKIKKSDQPLQKNQELYENAGLTPGAADLKDLNKFQAILDDYQIRVVSARHLNAISYHGKCNSCNIIFLYLDKERNLV